MTIRWAIKLVPALLFGCGNEGKQAIENTFFLRYSIFWSNDTTNLHPFRWNTGLSTHRNLFFYINSQFQSPSVRIRYPFGKCLVVLRWYCGSIAVVLRCLYGVILDRNTSAFPPHDKGNVFLIFATDIQMSTECV